MTLIQAVGAWEGRSVRMNESEDLFLWRNTLYSATKGFSSGTVLLRDRLVAKNRAHSSWRKETLMLTRRGFLLQVRQRAVSGCRGLWGPRWTAQSAGKLTISAEEPQTTAGRSQWRTTSAPHPLGGTTCSTWSPRGPQWDCTPVIHSFNDLYAYHNAFLPFFCSIPHSPASAFGVTFQTTCTQIFALVYFWENPTQDCSESNKRQ